MLATFPTLDKGIPLARSTASTVEDTAEPSPDVFSGDDLKIVEDSIKGAQALTKRTECDEALKGYTLVLRNESTNPSGRRSARFGQSIPGIRLDPYVTGWAKKCRADRLRFLSGNAETVTER